MTIGQAVRTMTQMRDYRGTKEFYLVLKKCIDTAQAGEKIHYKDIAAVMPGIPSRGDYMRRETASVLATISTEMHESGHPMLSAVVVRVDKRGPGKGFYDLAHNRLGLLDDDPEDMTEQKKLSFWEEELQRVYNHWQ